MYILIEQNVIYTKLGKWETYSNYKIMQLTMDNKFRCLADIQIFPGRFKNF